MDVDAEKLRVGRGLEEIQKRVESTITRYERMEQEERYVGLRRDHEAEATITELAEAGKARVEIILMALSQVSEERKVCLKDLKGLLEAQRSSFEQAEKEERDERRAKRSEWTDSYDEEMADQSSLLERLEALEILQHRLGDVGDAILARTRADAATLAMKAMKVEKDAAVSRLEQIEAEHESIVSELETLKTVDLGCAAASLCSQLAGFSRRQLRRTWVAHARHGSGIFSLTTLPRTTSQRFPEPHSHTILAPTPRSFTTLTATHPTLPRREQELEELHEALRRANEELTITKAARKHSKKSSTGGKKDHPWPTTPVNFSAYAAEEAETFHELCEASASLFRSVGGELERSYGLPHETVTSLVQLLRGQVEKVREAHGLEIRATIALHRPPIELEEEAPPPSKVEEEEEEEAAEVLPSKKKPPKKPKKKPPPPPPPPEPVEEEEEEEEEAPCPPPAAAPEPPPRAVATPSPPPPPAEAPPPAPAPARVPTPPPAEPEPEPSGRRMSRLRERGGHAVRLSHISMDNEVQRTQMALMRAKVELAREVDKLEEARALLRRTQAALLEATAAGGGEAAERRGEEQRQALGHLAKLDGEIERQFESRPARAAGGRRGVGAALGTCVEEEGGHGDALGDMVLKAALVSEMRNMEREFNMTIMQARSVAERKQEEHRFSHLLDEANAKLEKREVVVRAMKAQLEEEVGRYAVAEKQLADAKEALHNVGDAPAKVMEAKAEIAKLRRQSMAAAHGLQRERAKAARDHAQALAAERARLEEEARLASMCASARVRALTAELERMEEGFASLHRAHLEKVEETKLVNLTTQQALAKQHAAHEARLRQLHASLQRAHQLHIAAAEGRDTSRVAQAEEQLKRLQAELERTKVQLALAQLAVRLVRQPTTRTPSARDDTPKHKHRGARHKRTNSHEDYHTPARYTHPICSRKSMARPTLPASRLPQPHRCTSQQPDESPPTGGAAASPTRLPRDSAAGGRRTPDAASPRRRADSTSSRGTAPRGSSAGSERPPPPLHEEVVVDLPTASPKGEEQARGSMDGVATCGLPLLDQPEADERCGSLRYAPSESAAPSAEAERTEEAADSTKQRLAESSRRSSAAEDGGAFVRLAARDAVDDAVETPGSMVRLLAVAEESLRKVRCARRAAAWPVAERQLARAQITKLAAVEEQHFFTPRPAELRPRSSSSISRRTAGAQTARPAMPTAAGPSARTAWLLREGVGHSSGFAIKSAVAPALHPMDGQTLKHVLHDLFGQQRSLVVQRALGNWEVFGAMALLQPKLRRLDELQHALHAEAPPEGSAMERRTVQLRRVSEKMVEIDRQRRWLSQIWSMRRSAVQAVETRMLNQTLFTLTKLTDLANTQPPPRSMGDSPRLSKRDTLAGTVFSSPPILPFISLVGETKPISLAEPPEDWSPAGSFRNLSVQSHGMTVEQIQRLCVVHQFWPPRFDAMSARQQRQVLAEVLQYCLKGEPTSFPQSLVVDDDSRNPPESLEAIQSSANPSRPPPGFSAPLNKGRGDPDHPHTVPSADPLHENQPVAGNICLKTSRPLQSR
ncbi:hypothetical protein AB1Y20_005622 [Prymnesium parvum]|uniref:Uncharacterized protein n=1 Tax=Prymnesium parvum TaxID=97485 RepID=A0AB34J4P1_PRYPA